MIEHLKDLSNLTCDWVEGQGPVADMIISSRVRLARNLSDFVFLPATTEVQRHSIWKTIKHRCNSISTFNNAYYYTMSDLSRIEKEFLLECHLISREMTGNLNGRGVVISNDQKISIMVNEEDHLRVQIILSGLQLSNAWFTINKLDDDFSELMPYAFDKKLGYLTACPSNVGTGMRASLLMHLPALVLTKQIRKVFNSLNQLGLTVRGLYGEGSEMKGNLFQISNQITLGRSEIDLLEELERTTQQILSSEAKAREILIKEANQNVEDKIWRAYGLLRYARMISSDEVINLASGLRLGIAIGIIKDLTLKQLNELILLSQPAHLQSIIHKEVEPAERDFYRAQIIREKIENYIVENE